MPGKDATEPQRPGALHASHLRAVLDSVAAACCSLLQAAAEPGAGQDAAAAVLRLWERMPSRQPVAACPALPQGEPPAEASTTASSDGSAAPGRPSPSLGVTATALAASLCCLAVPDATAPATTAHAADVAVRGLVAASVRWLAGTVPLSAAGHGPAGHGPGQGSSSLAPGSGSSWAGVAAAQRGAAGQGEAAEEGARVPPGGRGRGRGTGAGPAPATHVGGGAVAALSPHGGRGFSFGRGRLADAAASGPHAPGAPYPLDEGCGTAGVLATLPGGVALAAGEETWAGRCEMEGDVDGRRRRYTARELLGLRHAAAAAEASGWTPPEDLPPELALHPVALHPPLRPPPPPPAPLAVASTAGTDEAGVHMTDSLG